MGLTNRSLSELLSVLGRIVRWQFLLDFSVGNFNYFGAIFSYLLVAIPIFAGKYDSLAPADLSALISRFAFVCIMLISSLSSIIDLSKQLTDIAGNLQR